MNTPAPSVSWEAYGNLKMGGEGSDQQIAVSSTHVGVSGRSALAFYTKTGMKVYGVTTAEDFFVTQGLTRPNAPGNYNVFDLRMIFDEYRRRFWVCALAADPGPNSDKRLFLCAVSKSENPLSGFWLYTWPQVPTAPGSGYETGDGGDYPCIGIGAGTFIQTNKVGASKCNELALSGNRIGVVNNFRNTALVKEVGAVAGHAGVDWTTQAGDCQELRLSGNRIGVLRTDRTVMVKEGGLDAGWTTQADACESLALSGNRIGVVKDDGTVWVKEGDLHANWVLQDDSCRWVRLSGNRIGVMRRDGTVRVKEGSLHAPWTTQADQCWFFVLSGNRIAVLQNPGVVKVKEGDLGAPWVTQADNCWGMALSYNRIGVARQDGTVMVKDGDLHTPWTVVADNSRKVALFSNRIAVLRNDGVVMVKEGSLDADWHTVAGSPFKHWRVVLRDANAMAGGSRLHINGREWWSLKNSDGSPAWGIQPAVHHGATNRIFLANKRGNVATVWAMDYPLAAGQSLLRADVALPETSGPLVDGPQKGKAVANPPPIAMGPQIGDIFLKAVWRHGKLYLTANSSKNWDGSGNRASGRLIRLNVANSPFTVEIDRIFGAASASDGKGMLFHYGWPSIEVNRLDIMVLSTTRTNSSIYPQVRLSIYYPSEDDMRSSILLRAGDGPYFEGSGRPYNFYGETVASCVDPSDDSAIWVASQYPYATSNNEANWSMWVAKL